MKKILIIADGILAKQFLEKVMETEAGRIATLLLPTKKKLYPKNVLKILNFLNLTQPVMKSLQLY